MKHTLTRKTVAEQLADHLAKDIFQGRFAWESTLPPIRKLAEQYGVTVPTTQRAIARIQEMGLVSVRHGSGMRVLNPKEHAGLAALPHWIEALADTPDKACEVLGDFLELRRVIALDLLSRAKDDVRESGLAQAHKAIDGLAQLAKKNAPIEEIVAADLAIVRALLNLRPQAAYSTIFNVFETLLETLPEIATAMYASPRHNAEGWAALMALMHQQGDLRATLEPILVAVDAQTLKQFAKELKKGRRR